jgi:hypothetical protein
MLDSHDEAVSGADAVPVPPAPATPEIPGPTTPEIKVEPADAILRLGPPEGKDSTRKGSSVFGRLLRFGARTAVVACLCGLAWAAGTYYPLRHSLLELLKPGRASEVQQMQQSPERGEIVRAMAQMAEEIRTLKASVESRAVAQDAVVENAKSRDGVKSQPDAAQTVTSAAIADLANRVDKMEAEFTTRLSRVNEQLAGIEQKIAASYAAMAPREPPPPRKRVAHPHDAFDPSRDPTAPGAPRPLGAR